MNIFSSSLLLVYCSVFYLQFHCVESLDNTCHHTKFRCDDGSKCLKYEQLCDGVEDCPNGEDETGNEQWDCTRWTLETTVCDTVFEIKCHFGGCADLKDNCNGIPNCWGATDESSDLCGNGAKVPVRHTLLSLHEQYFGGLHRRRTTTKLPPGQEDNVTTKRPSFFNYLANLHSKLHGSGGVPSHEEQEPETTKATTRAQSRPRATRPTIRTTTTPEPDPDPESVEETPEEPETEAKEEFCPPIPPERGVDMICKIRGKTFNCKKDQMPLNTVAEYRCSQYYVGALTAPPMLARHCRSGGWTERRKSWQCSLDCGNKSPEIAGFVVGGVAARPGKFPWHVGFYQQEPPGSGIYEFFCGGTLVHEKAVVTAAHCVTQKQSNEKRTDHIYVMMGKYNRSFSNNDNFVQKRSVRRIEVNEDYNYQNFDSDIAIVWLDKTVKITEKVRPVCLPRDEDDIIADSIYLGSLVGWGRTANRQFKEALQEVQLPVVGRRECQKASPELATLIRKTTFCAGYTNGTSTCDGDSGGGLIFEEANKWYLQGIVSAGVNSVHGGCNPNYYTIFTRVTSFVDWIQNRLYNNHEGRRK